VIDAKRQGLLKELKSLYPNEVILTETLPIAYCESQEKNFAILSPKIIEK
jgi:hypothetical protein